MKTRQVIEGWADASKLLSIVYFRKATGREVSDLQKPIDLLEIRRVYSKKLENFGLAPRDKFKVWKKIRITVEEIDVKENTR